MDENDANEIKRSIRGAIESYEETHDGHSFADALFDIISTTLDARFRVHGRDPTNEALLDLIAARYDDNSNTKMRSPDAPSYKELAVQMASPMAFALLEARGFPQRTGPRG